MPALRTRISPFFVLVLFLTVMFAGHALAAGHGAAAGNGSSGTGRAEGILVAEILLLLVVGRVLGEGMQRIGQPALMGTLLAGIILGPSLFGWV